jgi:hypothetical protein
METARTRSRINFHSTPLHQAVWIGLVMFWAGAKQVYLPITEEVLAKNKMTRRNGARPYCTMAKKPRFCARGFNSFRIGRLSPRCTCRRPTRWGLAHETAWYLAGFRCCARAIFMLWMGAFSPVPSAI